MMLTQETPTAPQTARRRTDWAKLFWMMKSSPLTLVGGVIIVLILLLMVLSPWITPHDPNAINLSARLRPPSAAHWFGTDEVGRDLFSRVLVGSQQSVVAGLVVVGIAGGIGITAGLLVGCHGRARRRDNYADDGHYAVHSFAGADDGVGRRAGPQPV
ncbi:Dipeptide transport system permease protein DppC (TC 3.A.1.5.2); Putative hemine transporter ATP-binding subunit [Citrobacter freundii]|uniref:Dipeptide transport system permease protein DppC (TC 3.A.1.5.2) Putative hemine transporter ATP-binding subunit n=1 Tax=Citrobacter freundii TaxID=546 RepID=A0A7G2J0C7_CITFR|nr:Dipeptide transport system permease protein DppC (TC 3.A.1.5.2); Putative hemine transporter ATP-binding subunit [Citrobacter freundii]